MEIRPVSKVTVRFCIIDFRVGSRVNHDVRSNHVKNFLNCRNIGNIQLMAGKSHYIPEFIKNSAYVPANLTICAGDKNCWFNRQGLNPLGTS